MQKEHNAHAIGRSMIEMLGVLALVGILSIGGIMMYRRAVNNHQANTILDDANRYVFAITEHGRGYPIYERIEGIDFDKTSMYFMSAFTGAKTEQFAIMVTEVPKGVCEALVEKASVDYKVRVMSAGLVEDINKVALNGVVYDATHTDICETMNDIFLYFGDTTGQCNPNETEVVPCSSNADCCGGQFCWDSNSVAADSGCTANGVGQCKLVSSYTPKTETMSDGNTWTHATGKTMNWLSAQNWCEAQGMRPVYRKDIGCDEVEIGQNCSSSEIEAIYDNWSDYGWHWLEPTSTENRIYIFYPSKYITYNGCGGRGFAFCR